MNAGVIFTKYVVVVMNGCVIVTKCVIIIKKRENAQFHCHSLIKCEKTREKEHPPVKYVKIKYICWLKNKLIEGK